MTKTPGERPGFSSFPWPRAYSPAWLALVIAALGYLATLLILAGYPGLRLRMSDAPGWTVALLDLVVVCLPLVVAVLAAGSVASRIGITRATGIRSWHGLDLVWGIGVGLALRALVELAGPTTGSFGGGFGQPELATLVVTAIGAALVSPFIEEWFFRGLVLRALLDYSARWGRAAAGIVSVLVSTIAFGALHFLPWGSPVAVPTLIGVVGTGLACAILTMLTGRLGAAIVAHVVFNAIGVGLMLAA